MDVQDVQVIPGRSANTSIFHVGDGYYYHVREVRPRRVRLKCRHIKKPCSGTGSMFFVSGKLKLRHLKPHVCERSPILADDIVARQELIQEAKSTITGASVRKILRDFKLRLNPDLGSRFTVARMHSALLAARSSNYPKLPRTLINLGILLGLPNMRAICKTTDGTDYIFQGVVGSQVDKTVSVVFASGRMLELLQSQPNLHMDGTFKKRPRKPRCRQIYNIVTNHGGTVVGLVRVLMRSRSQRAYVVLFEYVKSLAPGMRPNRIHCDFERAVINALRIVFPDADICVGRNANKLHLAELASNNDLIHSFIRCLCGAPLLPPALIAPTAEDLWKEVQAAGWAGELQDLFDYFRKEWVPRVSELSVFGHPERTNNCSESDNRAMANVLPQTHPSVWTLIGGFVQLEHLSRCDDNAVELGNAVQNPPRWKTVANNKRVQRLSNLLIKDEISPIRFLHEVSWVNQGALNHGMKTDRDSGSDSDSD
ncbi:Prostate and testis expressed protein 3 [Frankliniella fusca]|uniref:Prostate and testis expressed protein 3 n=1 Tax=Frankliniella fusca TaxID=407009 RepID=A0AAE1H8F0_9NEOP|nr:Prostate and testis expressed protein 3 [Frankliniella fusca]